MRTKRKAPTRADVARLAGVSTAVVSYVLNDGPRPVAPATKTKVLQAVEVLGYRPNAAARALSRGTTDTVAMFVADAANPFFAQLVAAMDSTATSMGMNLQVVSTQNTRRTLSEHFEDFAAQRVKGVISTHSASPAELAQAEVLGLRVVLVNQDEPQPGVYSVRVAYHEGARLAVRHLIEHGYDSVAFIGADERARLRERGWSGEISDAGITYVPPILTTYSLAGGYEAGQQLLAMNPRPRAVFVASDQMAMGVLSAVHNAGLRIPEDLAVVAFDGTAEGEYFSPPLTTVRQPVEEIAQAALGAFTSGSTEGASRIGTHLVVRRSCGCEPEGQ